MEGAELSEFANGKYNQCHNQYLLYYIVGTGTEMSRKTDACSASAKAKKVIADYLLPA